MNKPFSSLWNVADCYILVDPSIPFNTSVTGIVGSISGNAANPILDFGGATVVPSPNFSLNGFPSGYFTGFFVQIIDNLTGKVLEERKIVDFIQISIGSTQYEFSLDNNFSINWSGGANWYFKLILLPSPFIHLQPTDAFN